MKLHIGCGHVYLDGWTNVDVAIPGYSFLAVDRPDLVAETRTTVDHYYTRPYRRDGIVIERFCVADAFMDTRALDLPDNSADEILVVQLLEHFSREEAKQVLREWYRVLRPGGRLVVDTPDLEGLAREFLSEHEERREYYYRMIFGSQKNAGAYHKDGYSLGKLVACLAIARFVRIEDLGNPFGHPYPALTVGASKD